jgi:hypothetical protein
VLTAFSEDPDFDAAEHAFYYVRVIEIPTPRWTTYDAKRFGVMCGRRPRCKRNLACGLRSGASHVSGLFARHVTAGPDVIR